MKKKTPRSPTRGKRVTKKHDNRTADQFPAYHPRVKFVAIAATDRDVYAIDQDGQTWYLNRDPFFKPSWERLENPKRDQ